MFVGNERSQRPADEQFELATCSRRSKGSSEAKADVIGHEIKPHKLAANLVEQHSNASCGQLT
jgi:hypothetical protein